MTEQQADALMEEIEQLTISAIAGHSHPVLAALTALCRHRDKCLYYELYEDSVKLLVYPAVRLVQLRLDDMQTWEEL